MKPWWEREENSSRLAFELRSLDEAGIEYERDEAAFAAGQLKLLFSTEFQGRNVKLVAVFPDLYPYFRFEVSAPDEDLPRHQHPQSKYLCLIGRRTDNWEVTDTLAEFVRTQVPRTLELGRMRPEDVDPDETREERQGEPFSDYYPYVGGTILLVDSSWEIPADLMQGRMILKVENRNDGWIRGVVAEILDDSGTVVAKCDDALGGMFPSTVSGRWYRSPTEIRNMNPQEFLDELGEHKDVAPQFQPFGSHSVDVVGVVFPEEVAWRKSTDGWVFVLRRRERKRRGKPRTPREAHFIRPGRGGRSDLASRVPELTPLSRKSVALVGLGGLGAPSAIELARSGVGELRLLDYDFMEAGTAVRWPLGVPNAGLLKVELAGFIQSQWPFTRVVPLNNRLGSTRKVGDKSDLEWMDDLLNGVDLLFDASAELGIQFFLSQQARERDIAYIAVSATTGGWGGRVMRVVPGITNGCWTCMMHALTDGLVPRPPADPEGNLQPVGCADPTFTGSGFDLAPVVSEGVRMAVSTLCAEAEGGYPQLDWDVGILSLRGQDGQPIPASWWTSALSVHPDCLTCASAA